MNKTPFFPNQEITLRQNGIRLEPMALHHAPGLQEICQEDDLWRLRVTIIPHPSKVTEYINEALQAKQNKERYPFVVIEEATGKILGTSSLLEMTEDVRRVEIGTTWYAKCVHRTHVNTNCKTLLLTCAFEQLQANTVIFRADIYNLKSQKAIRRLGAKKDGILRGNTLRQDGTLRDSVLFSIIASEWPDVKAHLSALVNNLY